MTIGPLARDPRGAVGLMVGVMSPVMIGFLALTIDAGFWIIGQTRLQVAADAAAMGTSFLLSNAGFKSMSASDQTTTLNTVALSEAKGAMTTMMGTLTTPATVTMAADYSSVQVTLFSQASSYFGGVFNVTAPLMRATAIASVKVAAPCVLMLGSSGTDIQVDNSGTIKATGCGIASKATNPGTSTSSIYLDSGTITATTIVAAGTVTQSGSGSNKMTPSNPTQNATSVPNDPNASKTVPAPGTCTTHTDYTQYGTYTATPATWCGDQMIGGNGSTITFNPGVYIINNGSLTFNNASITSAAGVSFVLTGTNPGTFTWTNYSNTTQLSAPASGPTAGIAIWQACNSTQTTSSFQGGGTLAISGSIYMPCSKVDIGNNAQLLTGSNGSFNLISKSVYVHGSGQLSTSPSGSSGGSATAVLTQ